MVDWELHEGSAQDAEIMERRKPTACVCRAVVRVDACYINSGPRSVKKGVISVHDFARAGIPCPPLD